MLESFWYECWSDIHLQLMYMLMLDTRVTLHDPLDKHLDIGQPFPYLYNAKRLQFPKFRA